MKMISRSHPPAAYKELVFLRQRWSQIDSWLEDEIAAMYSYKEFIYEQAQWIRDRVLRIDTRMAALSRIERREQELENIENEWRSFYHEAYSKLNFSKILEYAVEMRPAAREEMKAKSKARAAAYMKKIKNKQEKDKK